MRKKIQDILARYKKNQDDVDSVKYRLAEKEDIYYLLAIERDIYDGDVPWTYSHFVHEIEVNDKSIFMVATKQGKVVGFSGCRIDLAHKSIHITNLAVKKSAQGQGIAKGFIREFDKLAKTGKLKKISLEVKRTNYRAQAIYRRAGFHSDRIIMNYYEDGTDGIWMEKNYLD